MTEVNQPNQQSGGTSPTPSNSGAGGGSSTILPGVITGVVTAIVLAILAFFFGLIGLPGKVADIKEDVEEQAKSLKALTTDLSTVKEAARSSETVRDNLLAADRSIQSSTSNLDKQVAKLEVAVTNLEKLSDRVDEIRQSQIRIEAQLQGGSSKADLIVAPNLYSQVLAIRSTDVLERGQDKWELKPVTLVGDMKPLAIVRCDLLTALKGAPPLLVNATLNGTKVRIIIQGDLKALDFHLKNGNLIKLSLAVSLQS